LASRQDLAEFAQKKAEEEDGHADLAYRDLESLGLPAAEVIRLIRPPSADVFAERFRMYTNQESPIAMFGFSYCLERMAVGRDDLFVQRIRSICPRNTSAMRFLKVHSNIGSDSAHVEEQLALFESMDGADLAAVTLAAFETAEMLARQPLMDHMLTDAEICRRLACAGINLSTIQKEELPAL
jgi:pyrroloquinoline quinone (PQQ) biosynthesis protein C